MMGDMSYRDYNSLLDDYGSIGSLGSYQPNLSTSPTGLHESHSFAASPRARSSLPRVLLMGTRRSGKSSISKVVFNKMSPHETLFLESTNEIRVRDINTSQFMQFALFDFPGNFDFYHYNQKYSASGSDNATSAASGGHSNEITPEQLFGRTSTLIYVIDAQDDQNDFSECVDYFMAIVKKLTTINQKINIEILIHKFDGDIFQSLESKNDTYCEIKNTLLDELAEAKFSAIIQPSFYATSIYDHSIFEAFSKICQKLIFSLNLLENLLDSVVFNCELEKIFLFDVVSKIYLASDSNPVDVSTYELCSDMIDVVVDVIHIYGTSQSSLPPSLSQSQSLSMQGSGDDSTSSVIELSNDYVLYYRSVSKYLSLVSLMRHSSFTKRGLVDYNFNCLREAINRIIEVKQEAQRTEEQREREKRAIKQAQGLGPESVQHGQPIHQQQRGEHGHGHGQHGQGRLIRSRSEQ